MPEAAPRRVVVVGGGITGLATAWFLRDRASVTVLEESDRLGGKIRTEALAGVPVEAGPDTFLAREPEAVDLCRQLGLGDDLVAPANSKAWLWSGSSLHRLPEPHVLGVPLALRPLLRSGLLSRAGVARATLDLVLPRRPFDHDASVADVVGGRLGTEILDRLVEPLVGGIHAGVAADLSLASTAPPLAAAARTSRSLVLGLRRSRGMSRFEQPVAGGRAAPMPAGPLFLGVSGGLERMIERLRTELEAAGVTLRTGVRVTAVEAGPIDGTIRVTATTAGPVSAGPVSAGPAIDLDADAVVVTVPAFAAAPMLAGSAPAAAAELASIRTASVSLVTLGYPPDAVPAYLDGAGFLVPRVDGRLITACTWTTSKWPELRRGGLVLLRASAGRAGDTRALALGDDALVARVHTELAQALGLRSDPVVSLVSRWPDSFPQYQPGHADRVDRIEAALRRELPPVTVAGASYRGVGIAACIRQARVAADRAAEA